MLYWESKKEDFTTELSLFKYYNWMYSCGLHDMYVFQGFLRYVGLTSSLIMGIDEYLYVALLC